MGFDSLLSGVEAVKWLPLANGYTNVLSIILNDLCIFILLIKTNKKRLATKNHNPPYMRKTRSIPTTNQLRRKKSREGAVNPPPAGWRQPLSSLLNRWRLAHDTGEFCERLREKCMKNGSIIHQINRELQSQLRIGEKRERQRLRNRQTTPRGSSAIGHWRSTQSSAAVLQNGAKRSTAAVPWRSCGNLCRSTSGERLIVGCLPGRCAPRWQLSPSSTRSPQRPGGFPCLPGRERILSAAGELLPVMHTSQKRKMPIWWLFSGEAASAGRRRRPYAPAIFTAVVQGFLLK